MDFAGLLIEVKKLKFLETRADSLEELEFVYKANQLRELSAALEQFFGPPLKPAGKPPSKEAQQYAESHGGVFDNQTLYYVHQNGKAYGAMFWPWQDKVSVTVKIFEASSS